MPETHAAMTLTTENFQTEVLESDVPVLVDFWATWCAPCRQIAPMIEELAETYAGKAKIGKVDGDENRALLAQLEVRAFPTLLFFKGGEVVERIIGVKPKTQLVELLDQLTSD